MELFDTFRLAPDRNRMPLRPSVVPDPLISRPLSVMRSLAPAEMMMPFVPEARTPPSVARESLVIALVIVTAPNPPGSRQLISPLAAVFEIAPANVLQGAVRLHGLASSPTPETHVRVAWAEAVAGSATAAISAA